MKRYHIFFIILILVVFILIYMRSHALRDSTVSINSASFKVTLAKTPDEQAQGLSGWPNLHEDAGMLFLFDKPFNNNFWMRGMKFPLDIIFILGDKVVGVHENLPPADDADSNPPVWGGENLSDRVLEINAGLAKRYGIKVGDAVHYDIKD